jgi:outer membrane murein-binding lipoprotein Lpp
MMPPAMSHRLLLLPVALLLAGCATSGRVDNLEKQIQTLQAQVAKLHSSGDIDQQAKCSKDAREYFGREWPANKDTIMLDYSNHYSPQRNQCLILVEDHYGIGDTMGSWNGLIVLYNVYEHTDLAKLSESNIINRVDFNTKKELIECEVQGDKCSSASEFYNRVRPFMNK